MLTLTPALSQGHTVLPWSHLDTVMNPLRQVSLFPLDRKENKSSEKMSDFAIRGGSRGRDQNPGASGSNGQLFPSQTEEGRQGAGSLPT